MKEVKKKNKMKSWKVSEVGAVIFFFFYYYDRNERAGHMRLGKEADL